MSTINSDTYITVKNKNNADWLCPVSADRTAGASRRVSTEDCFEKDVAERYSGNIVVES